jgi:ribosomal protein L7/L12
MSKWILGLVVAFLVVAAFLRRGERVPTFEDGAQPTEGDIDRLIAAGRQIDAIKAYRRLHRVGLKEAKDAIDERAKRLPGPTG